MKMKILWLGSFPVSTLQPLPVEHKHFQSEHPVPWIINLSTALAANHPEIELHIANTSALVKRSFTVRRDGLTIHVAKSSVNLIFGKSKAFSSKFLVLTRYYRIRRLLNKIIQDVEPDIVHAFGTENAYSLAAMDSGLPYIVYLQGIMQKLSGLDTYRRVSSTSVDLEKKVFDHCRYYIAETAYGEEFIHNTVPEAKVWRVSNSVSAPYFNVSHNGTVNRKLMFVGSILQRKGVEELLSAVNNNGWSLTIVGTNTQKYARELMHRYRNNSKIVWTGHIPIGDVTTLMETHDSLVLPSYMDTSPYVVAEAMAAGLPVIASRVGGIPDMIKDGETGFLAEPKSVESLEEAIKKLYANPDNMIKMGFNARKVALNKFNPSLNAQLISKAYSHILKKQNSDPTHHQLLLD